MNQLLQYKQFQKAIKSLLFDYDKHNHVISANNTLVNTQQKIIINQLQNFISQNTKNTQLLQNLTQFINTIADKPQQWKPRELIFKKMNNCQSQLFNKCRNIDRYLRDNYNFQYYLEKILQNRSSMYQEFSLTKKQQNIISLIKSSKSTISHNQFINKSVSSIISPQAPNFIKESEIFAYYQALQNNNETIIKKCEQNFKKATQGTFSKFYIDFATLRQNIIDCANKMNNTIDMDMKKTHSFQDIKQTTFLVDLLQKYKEKILIDAPVEKLLYYQNICNLLYQLIPRKYINNGYNQGFEKQPKYKELLQFKQSYYKVGGKYQKLELKDKIQKVQTHIMEWMQILQHYPYSKIGVLQSEFVNKILLQSLLAKAKKTKQTVNKSQESNITCITKIIKQNDLSSIVRIQTELKQLKIKKQSSQDDLRNTLLAFLNQVKESKQKDLKNYQNLSKQLKENLKYNKEWEIQSKRKDKQIIKLQDDIKAQLTKKQAEILQLNIDLSLKTQKIKQLQQQIVQSSKNPQQQSNKPQHSQQIPDTNIKSIKIQPKKQDSGLNQQDNDFALQTILSYVKDSKIYPQYDDLRISQIIELFSSQNQSNKLSKHITENKQNIYILIQTQNGQHIAGFYHQPISFDSPSVNSQPIKDTFHALILQLTNRQKYPLKPNKKICSKYFHGDLALGSLELQIAYTQPNKLKTRIGVASARSCFDTGDLKPGTFLGLNDQKLTQTGIKILQIFQLKFAAASQQKVQKTKSKYDQQYSNQIKIEKNKGDQNKSKQSKNQKIQSQNKKANKMQQLQTNIKQYENKSKQNEEKIKTLNRSLEARIASLEFLQKQNEQLKQTTQNLSKQIEKLNTTIKDLEKQLQAQKNTKNFTNVQNDMKWQKKTSKLNEEWKKQISTLKINYEKIEKQLQQRQKQLEKIQSINQKNQNIIKSNKTTIRSLQEQKRELLNNFKSSQDRRIVFQQKVKKLSQNGGNKFLLAGLFQNNIFEDKTEYKDYLISVLQSKMKKLIKKTKLLYAYDPLNMTNFHNYIDQKPNLILIVRTKKDYWLAGFTEGSVNPKNQIKNQNNGYLISLNNRKIFQFIRDKQNAKAVSYQEYFLIFGNSQLRLKFGESTIFSNLGILSRYYNTESEKADILFGQGLKKEVQFSHYEIYQVFFDGQ